MKPEVLVELKALRLHGMAGAWANLRPLPCEGSALPLS